MKIFLKFINGLSRAFIWLCRVGYCKGFHVQSPSDYRFICYVINERYPYYSYFDLQKEKYIDDVVMLKLCRLYFRVSNFIQASVCIDFAATESYYTRYIKAGCNKTRIVSISDNESSGYYDDLLEQLGTVEFLRISLISNNMSFIRKALEKVRDNTVFIIEGIKINKQARYMWKELIADSRVRITFDLYYCGIIFFDSSRYKQNYIVNF